MAELRQLRALVKTVHVCELWAGVYEALQTKPTSYTPEGLHTNYINSQMPLGKKNMLNTLKLIPNGDKGFLTLYISCTFLPCDPPFLTRNLCK